MSTIDINVTHTIQWRGDFPCCAPPKVEPTATDDGPAEGMRRVTINVDNMDSGTWRKAAADLDQIKRPASANALRTIAGAIDAQDGAA